MPELPEVETVRTILEGIVEGKTIKAIHVYRAKNIVSGADAFIKSLIGETFLSVSRKGKYLLFHLSHDKVVISHLRMEGKYYEGKVGDTPDKFDLLVYDFTDGSSLRYNDVRKFGVLKLTNEENAFKEEPLLHLGPEPWDLTPEALYLGLQKRKNTTIKEALLDQSLIAGLGNIYDDETLFAAKVNPKRLAGSITKEEAASLLIESRRILKTAIAHGGSTIRSYHPSEGVDGLMQNELLAYGQENEPCSRCGFPLRKIFIGGRGTVYCPHCQPYFGHPLVVAVSGPIASGKSTVSAYLEKKGYRKLDADEIVAELYQKPSVQKRIAHLLGESVLTPAGLDRKAMLVLLSATPKKKKALEKMIHPLVYREILAKLASMASGKVVLDVPLLLHSPLEEVTDLIIYISANEKNQIARLVERGKDPERSLALNKGYPRALLKKKAGILLSGDGRKEDLIKELDSYSFL
jgi:formamidopyrimidine-DNA glycosylase